MAATSVTVLLWASAFVAIRDAAPHFRPGALALGRLLVACVVLGAILIVRREPLPARGAWPGIAVCGVLWFGVYMVALNAGERDVDAGTAAMIIQISPVLIALGAAWRLREPLRGRLVAGMVVSFAGTAVVAAAQSQAGGSITGVLLCALAAVSYTIAMLVQKVALGHASALSITAWSCFVGALACLPFAGQLISDTSSAPAGALFDVVYLGIGPTAIAFTTWAYALARTTAGALGATTYIVPALVILLSWLLLGEVPTSLAVAGGTLCVAGVAVARSRDHGGRAGKVAPDRSAVRSGAGTP
ncbi:MAG: DMT family transporter [bacterium]